MRLRTPDRTALATTAVVAVASLTLAACSGGGGTEGSGGSAGGSEGGPTELLAWHGYTEADGDVLQSIVDQFNASQDDYEVKTEEMAWTSISEKLLTSLGAGNGPNLVVQGVDTGLGYANQGAFVSMQDYYDDEQYTENDNFYPNLVEQVTFDGEAYGVPMGTTAFAVYYNPALWQAAGLTEADYPTTVDELLEVARTLTLDADGNGEPEQYGFALPDQDAGLLSALLHTGGGDFITDGENGLYSEENVATLEQWQSAYVDDKISPTGMDATAAMELFGSGRAAMIVNGPWEITSAASFGIEVGVFEWPGDWVHGVANYWYATSMNDSEEELAGVRAFSDWWNSRDMQVEWTESYYPPNRDDIEQSEFAYPIIATLAGFSNNAHYYATGISTSVSDITAETDAMMTNIAQGGDVEELLQAASDKVDGYLANE
ncbi:extracellular solute-binding protein [Cellulomonas endophytica]|uniref:extracellular solute-binding protein n=1 Tax=Cellulomonas endophytica TaxID=2494735 RepID=UPI0013E91A09|nr:extracellular solute-binding protein [Cellulomonas endophytica]